MNYKLIFTFVVLLFLSSCQEKKNTLVVYPEYCGGCVIRNFTKLKETGRSGEFDIYFDTTDAFVLSNAKKSHFKFHHISNDAIAAKWGDYANVVVINTDGKVTELKTNETIQKGVHY